MTDATTPDLTPAVVTDPSGSGLDLSAPTLREALGARLRVEDLAFSREGVTFTFEVAAASGVQVGSYVVLETAGTALLAQVEDVQFVVRQGPEIRVSFHQPIRIRAGGVAEGGSVHAELRLVEGGGRVLGELVDGALRPYGGPGFTDATIRRATDAEVGAMVDDVRGATLAVGRLREADAPARLVASGFARHTFLCGQSGSGKTYSTGVLLEQLLMRTDLRIVVLDPNSDHVHLDEVPGVATGPDADVLREAARGVEVLSGEGLRMHVRDLDDDLRARLLRLDPLVDRAEYNAFRRLIAAQSESPVDHLPDPSQVDDPVVRELLLRAQNLGVDSWDVWGRLDPTSVLRRLDADDWRALVVDLGSLATQHERDATAAAVLARLWGNRMDRRPVLIVIDEAHNVAPDATDDPVRALATDLAITIAGEGRKFGLHLLVATQRPAKVHVNVVSQCDNLVLMRLNSRSDVDEVTRIFSHVPPEMVRAAPTFGLGEALVAGRISPTPQLIKFGARITREGGGDVPTDWARVDR